MCGRFVQTIPLQRIQTFFHVDVVTCDQHTNYNVSPSQDILAVVFGKGQNRLGTLSWGFLPQWAADRADVKPVINARAETVLKKPFFRKAFVNRRCIIPADGFYEWQKMGGGKQPWYIYHVSGQPLAFAGIWSVLKTNEGKDYRSCAVITVEAIEPVGKIHPRMPAMLTPEAAQQWLKTETGNEDEIQRILYEGGIQNLNLHPVSGRVNNPENNDGACIEPVSVPE